MSKWRNAHSLALFFQSDRFQQKYNADFRFIAVATIVRTSGNYDDL
ncbi:hypothetical protein [Okeania sp. SIO1I7]|nr:hypothetical protein [Okeania sp. SIO1I7]NET26106.1 hypothetical protein [Okeania sp. SIO1I7]